MAWFLYLSYSCRLPVHTALYQSAMNRTRRAFPVSAGLSVALQVLRAPGGCFKTVRALWGRWEHIKSKWPTGTQLSFLLAPCCCNDLPTPVRISLHLLSSDKNHISPRNNSHHPLPAKSHSALTYLPPLISPYLRIKKWPIGLISCITFLWHLEFTLLYCGVLDWNLCLWTSDSLLFDVFNLCICDLGVMTNIIFCDALWLTVIHM